LHDVFLARIGKKTVTLIRMPDDNMVCCFMLGCFMCFMQKPKERHINGITYTKCVFLITLSY